MKKSEAKPGTKVLASITYEDDYGGGMGVGKFALYGHDDYTLVGTVLDTAASEGKVWVKWEEGDLREEEEEIEIKLLTLQSDRASLEDDFKKVAKEIKDKVKQAADLVREAGKLAKTGHVKSLQSMYQETRPLVNAMDDNGWRSSSWGC